jgi:hypothetical protein
MTTGREKRREGRFVVEGLQGHMTFASEVELLNMSVSGVALRTDRRLSIGQRYQLRLESASGVPPLTLHGIVVWCALEARRKDTRGEDILIYSAGLRFADVISDSMQALLNFLDQHKVHPDQRTGGTRFEIEATGRTLLDVPHPFKVKVLSLTGMLALATGPLELERELPMELSFDEGEPLSFEGRVAYCTEVDLDEGPEFEIGIEFVKMAPDERARLEAYIERLKAR